MNIIDAIKLAKEYGTAVISPTGFTTETSAFGPGKFSPEWLLTTCKTLSEHALLSDKWEVEDPQLLLNKERFTLVMREEHQFTGPAVDVLWNSLIRFRIN